MNKEPQDKEVEQYWHEHELPRKKRSVYRDDVDYEGGEQEHE